MKTRYLKIFILILVVHSCAVKTNLQKGKTPAKIGIKTGVKATGKVVEKPKKEPAKIEEEKQGKIWGIDISHYQDITDWSKLQQQEPGFIFLKASEGSTIQDSKYTENYKAIRQLNIPVGSYHFFSYKSTAKEQAKNFLSIVRYQSGDLPLVLDAEFAKVMPAKELVRKELFEFMTIIYYKTGIYPIIYCPYKYYNTYLREGIPAECKLWIVDYRGKPNCNWTFWQTTEKYKMGGIKGYVDFNLFYGSMKDFKTLLH